MGIYFYQSEWSECPPSDCLMPKPFLSLIQITYKSRKPTKGASTKATLFNQKIQDLIGTAWDHERASSLLRTIQFFPRTGLCCIYLLVFGGFKSCCSLQEPIHINLKILHYQPPPPLNPPPLYTCTHASTPARTHTHICHISLSCSLSPGCLPLKPAGIPAKSSLLKFN